MTVNYRDGYNMFACNGILFNHESPRRGETFVTRKITKAIANILLGNQKTLYLGNLNAKRDWGFAPEYVTCQWMIMQQDIPDDYVIGTGESNSVREFVEHAFNYAGIEIEWKGKGVDEKGVIRSLRLPSRSNFKTGDILVEIDPRYYRPTEVDFLLADISKARKKIGWEPRVKFSELVKIMVDADMKLSGLQPPGEGERILQDKGLHWTQNQITKG